MNKILTNFTSFIYFFFSRFSFDTRVYEFLKQDELLGNLVSFLTSFVRFEISRTVLEQL